MLTRARAARLVLPGAALLVGARPAYAQAAPTPGRPNVLFIAVDDLRPLLGAYGERHVRSPNIDRLAAGGALFTRAYAQQAWCSPSRTSLLTGRRPDRTGVRDLETHFRATVPRAVTLPQHFRGHGYLTAAVGKVFHEGLDDTLSWSVPTWAPDVPNPLMAYALPEHRALAASRRGYAAATERAEVADDAYPDGQLAARAVDMLRTFRGRPFFLAVGFYKPHLPFAAPARYWDLYDPARLPGPAAARPPRGAPPYAFMAWAEHHNYAGVPRVPNGVPLPEAAARRLTHGYYAAVSYVDAQVGRVLDELDRLGLRDDTIVVLWGDHGWKLGDYAGWSKHTNYEVDTRVPLVIRAPGARSTRAGGVTELIDVYPTLAELAGLPAPQGVQGVSLAGPIQGRGAPAKPAFSEFIRNEGRTHTTDARATVLGQAVRTDRYRLVRWLDRRRPHRVLALELYDHHRDPDETVNRAGQPAYARATTRLVRLLDANLRVSVARQRH